MSLYNFDNLELLKVARDVAEQKGLSFEIIVRSIESAIQVISKKKYGNCKIKVNIDRKTGVISLYRELMVIGDNGEIVIKDQSGNQQAINKNQEDDNEKEGDYQYITLSEAVRNHPQACVGDVVFESLPNVDLDYNSAKIAKNKVAQVIKFEERKKQYEEFKDRKGDLIYGVVKRIDYGNIIVDLNSNEGYLPSQNLIKGEVFRPGDKIKSCVEDVKQSSFGPQIFLSRVSKGFMEQLLKQEITEVYDGIVTIKSIARDPGSRAKVAVFSSDKNIDAVGACVGPRGSRIRNVTAELHGEKIDVILYSSDLGKFVVNAIAPAEVLKVIIYEDTEKVELVVPEDQISLAIGRKGQNIKLASELIERRIDILGDAAESTRRAEELTISAKLLIEALNVEEIIAQLLFTENYVNVEDIHKASISDIASIEGFNEEIAAELKSRAAEYLKSTQDAQKDLDQSISALPFLQHDDVVKLLEHGIKTMEDIAELSRDEFCEIAPNVALSQEEVDKVIIEARKKMGWL